MSLGREVRNAVYAIDPQQPVAKIRTLEQVRENSLASARLTTLLLGAFAALALLVTATGITGIIAFSVSQRTQEIGVRVALGAGRVAVLGMVLRQACALVLAGLAVGVFGALALTRLLSQLLFGVEPTDPLTFIAVSTVLLAVASGASVLPARRALAISPLEALRSV